VIAIAIAVIAMLEFVADVVIEILAAVGVAYHHPGMLGLNYSNGTAIVQTSLDYQ